MQTGTFSKFENPSEKALLRDQIDALDDAIADLVLRRTEISQRIIAQKSSETIIDAQREEEIAQRYFSKLKNVSTWAKVKKLVAGVISTTLNYPD